MSNLLGHVDICGIKYKLMVGEPSENVNLIDAYGYCESLDQEIWLRRGLSKARARQVLLHEILHAIVAESGVQEVFVALTKVGKLEQPTAEEAMVSMLAPPLGCALESIRGIKV